MSLADDIEAVFGLRKQLWGHGYRPVAVYTKSKSPFGLKWRALAKLDPPEAATVRPREDALSTGVLSGEVSGVDIDVLDQGLSDIIRKRAEELFGPTMLVRVGQPPKVLLVYCAATPFAKIATPDLFLPDETQPDGIKCRVEILGEGQQFVVDGIHPDTQQPYRWIEGYTPYQVPVASLPVITEENARAFVADAERILRDAGAKEKPKQKEATPRPAPIKSELLARDDTFFSRVNRIALENAGLWFRRLFPKARFEPGTGAWRISSKDLGRDLEEDISIHPSGIRDFGEEEPCSAIDLVMRHGGAATAVDAALRICDWLGRAPENLGYTKSSGSDSDPITDSVGATTEIARAFENIFNAGELGPIEPRQWLLGTALCRRFLSALLGDGGVGKTALRFLQYVSLAIGRSLTGEHVHHRTRVLLVCLEDDLEEARRRIRAIMIYHNVSPDELDGWLYIITPSGLKLLKEKDGEIKSGGLDILIRRIVETYDIGLVAIDPFVKSHGVDENDNNSIDQVCIVLAKIASELSCAVDVIHHTRKGAFEPGNADAGRGASALKDGARLVRTITKMSTDEAKAFGVAEGDRQLYVRVDNGKINLARPAAKAQWFELIGVRLGNSSALYPHGDEVQTVEPWVPTSAWDGLSYAVLNAILDDIDAGLPNGSRYSDKNAAKARAAWQVIQKHVPSKTESQCKEIIKTWVKNGVLFAEEYIDPTDRHDAVGLRVDPTKRPS